jgi:hypothetical protein
VVWPGVRLEFGRGPALGKNRKAEGLSEEVSDTGNSI